MTATLTRYTVPRWGVGELWTRGELVLAHEFAFEPVSDTGDEASRNAPAPNPPATDGGAGRIAPGHAASACGAIDTVLARQPLDTERCLTPTELTERFVAFFEGEEVSFDDLRLDLSGATGFQRRVASALRGIPRGQVVSYGELAVLAGRPGAARAAGTFCAKNRFMLILPCHRVVGSNGIGGYGSAGVAVKRRLLALEGVDL